MTRVRMDWERLTAAYTATRTFREKVFGDTSGAGTTGVDDRYAAEEVEGIGCEIMGAGSSGCTRTPTIRIGKAGGATRLRSEHPSTCSRTPHRVRRFR